MILLCFLQNKPEIWDKKHLFADVGEEACMLFEYVLQILGNLCIIRVTYRWQMAGVW